MADNTHEIVNVEHVEVSYTYNPDDYGDLPNSNHYGLYLTNYSYLLIDNIRSNCKAWSIDHLSSVLAGNPNDVKTGLHKLDMFLIKRARCLIFTVNVTSMRYIDILSTKFKLVSINKVPVGYQQGFQYHAVFLTNYKNYSNYGHYKARCMDESTVVMTDEKFDEAFTPNKKGWLKKYLKSVLTK